MKVFLAIFAVIFAVAAAKDYYGYEVLEVVPENYYQLQTLKMLKMTQNDLDFWLEPTTEGRKVHIMVSPELSAELKWTLELQGMKINIIDEDVQMTIEAERERMDGLITTRDYDFNDFNRYDDFMTALDDFASSCAEGFTCSTTVAGQSSEGRDLKYLEINTPNTEGGTIMIDALTHAREWLSGATVMNIVRILLDQHPDYSDGRAFAEKYNWVILPLVNPDGYEYTHTDDRLWRKSRKGNVGSGCVGTDINRNYDYNWGNVPGGSSGSPCSDTYRGVTPADNPETETMQDLADSVQPFAYLSFHTYGEYWLEPYGDGTPVENSQEHGAITDDTCDAIQSTFNEAIWRCGNSADVLYGTDGTTADYMRGNIATCNYAWTPELRGPGFIVDVSEIAPSVEEIWNGLKVKFDHPDFSP